MDDQIILPIFFFLPCVCISGWRGNTRLKDYEIERSLLDAYDPIGILPFLILMIHTFQCMNTEANISRKKCLFIRYYVLTESYQTSLLH